MSITDFNSHFWGEVSKKCNRAVVFIDSPSAECLHWNGGMSVLSKARAVKDFSVFESAPAGLKKAVFIISGPITGPNKTTLQSVIENSSLEYVVLISNCHPSVQTWSQYPARDWNSEDRTGYDQLEQQVLAWMGNVNFTAEIFFFPLFLISLTPRLLLTPGFTSLSPLLEPDLVRAGALWRSQHPAQSLPPPAGHWDSLPLELQVNLRSLVASLHCLLGTLAAREEIWSVGRMAGLLGEQLEAWSPARARRRTAENRVSLVLVDRSLDLASAVQGGTETVLGRALVSLDKLPGHSVDRAVNLSTIFGMSSDCGSDCLVPGSLASPGLDITREEEELESLVFSSEKDCLALLHKNLTENSPKKKSNSPSRKFTALSSLEAALREFTGDYEAILSNLSTVSRAAAAVSSVTRERGEVRGKKVQSLMSQLGRTLCEGGGRVLTDLTDLVRSRRDSQLRLDDLLLLLVFVYSSVDVRDSLAGEQEERLKAVLGEALLSDGERGEAGDVLQELCERHRPAQAQLDEVVALNVINSVWERLEGLRTVRAHLPNYQSLLNYDGELSGVLGRLLGEIYHEDRREVTSLQHHSSEGLGAMLRSGLGWLGSAPSKPHPRENPWIIMFVVGGVTAAEVRDSQQRLQGVGRLTVASTRLLSPADSLTATFLNNNLMT